jgi:hypothetical protein
MTMQLFILVPKLSLGHNCVIKFNFGTRIELATNN